MKSAPNQVYLWDAPGPTLSRRTDPETSQQAAKFVMRTGSASSHRAMVLAEICDRPGQTSAELADVAGLERHEAARRCSDLKRMGIVQQGEARRCRINGTLAVTWWPKEIR